MIQVLLLTIIRNDWLKFHDKPTWLYLTFLSLWSQNNFTVRVIFLMKLLQRVLHCNVPKILSLLPSVYCSSELQGLWKDMGMPLPESKGKGNEILTDLCYYLGWTYLLDQLYSFGVVLNSSLIVPSSLVINCPTLLSFVMPTLKETSHCLHGISLEPQPSQPRTTIWSWLLGAVKSWKYSTWPSATAA